MRIFFALLIIITTLVAPIASASTNIVEVRTQDKLDHTRFILDTTSSPKYQAFVLNSPPRLVIDIENANWNPKISGMLDSGRIKQIRHSKKPNGTLRIVLDLNHPLKDFKTFTLFPEKDKLSHLVAEVYTDIGGLKIIPAPVTKKGNNILVPKPKIKPNNIKKYKPLIVIDAGHGGRDPGAIGRRRTKEKNITLAFAKSLRDILIKSGKYRVKLTRDRDVFIKLRRRVKIAQDAKADLFISLHADSHRNRNTRGLSVYTLSEKASDKEAEILARKANSYGDIGTIRLRDDTKNSELSSLLVDLVQRDTKNQSSSFAEMLVSQLKREVKLLRNTHRFAGFRVLTAPDIPSVLIELGYLSNKSEESLLRKTSYRKKIVSAIHRAINVYFEQFTPQ